MGTVFNLLVARHITNLESLFILLVEENNSNIMD